MIFQVNLCGIMVSRSGFQAGAKSYAKNCGIKLFRLHCPNATPIKLTDIGFATLSLDLKDHQLRARVFKPVASIRFFVKGTKLPKFKMPLKLLFRDMPLADATGGSLGTVRDVLAGFVTQMRPSNSLKESFVKTFDQPTFVALSSCPVELNAISADIEIEVSEHDRPFGPWGLTDFILDDLDSGKSRIFKRPALVSHGRKRVERELHPRR